MKNLMTYPTTTRGHIYFRSRLYDLGEMTFRTEEQHLEMQGMISELKQNGSSYQDYMKDFCPLWKREGYPVPSLSDDLTL